MLKRLLQDMKDFADIDREIQLCYDRNEEPAQEQLDKYCETTALAMQILEEHNEDLYNEYSNKGTIGNEMYLFVDVIECLIGE